MSPDYLHDRGRDEEVAEFEIDDPELLTTLEASIAEADRGEVIPWDEMMRQLREMRERHA